MIAGSCNYCVVNYHTSTHVNNHGCKSRIHVGIEQYSGSLLAALERKSLLYTIFISEQAVSVLILLTGRHFE